MEKAIATDHNDPLADTSSEEEFVHGSKVPVDYECVINSSHGIHRISLDPIVNSMEFSRIDGENLEFMRFDPMKTIEAAENACSPCQNVQTVGVGDGFFEIGGSLAKWPRVRPKKVSQSQREALYSAPTPVKSLEEAQNTWNNAKMLGISSRDKVDVVNEIRKSKCLLLLDAATS